MDLTEELEEDLIIVDDDVMVDMWLFFVLISKVKNGARVVLSVIRIRYHQWGREMYLKK